MSKKDLTLEEAEGFMTNSNPRRAFIEYKKKLENERKYNNWLAKKRKEKEKRQKELKINIQNVDMGMVPADGLESPDPGLPPADEPLWQMHKAKEDPLQSLRLSIRSKRPQSFDPDNIIKKKYRSKPVGSRQVKDCHLTLSEKSLTEIASGPQVLDLGEVSVFSKNLKSFTVFNGLGSFIRIGLENMPDDLKHSFPDSQVIPPAGTAGFDINFEPKTVKTYQETVSYLVNGQHELSFELKAEVVPIDIQLSTSTLELRFNEFNLEPVCTDSVVLRNTGNSLSKFEWEGDNPAFQIEPQYGTIKPFESLTATVTYSPPIHENESEQEMLLKVRGATAPKKLTCLGEVQDAKCVFAERRIFLGVISVGIEKKREVRIKNVGQVGTIFHIRNDFSDIKVSPSRGHIPVSEEFSIGVEAKPQTAKNFNTSLVARIRGGGEIKLPIRGEAKYPSVELVNDVETINFGGVFVGASSIFSLRLKNTSSDVTAIGVLDFREHPEFQILDEEGNEISDAPTEYDRSGISLYSFQDQKQTMSDSDEISETDSNDDDDEFQEKGSTYKFTIQHQQILDFQILFRPKAVTTHQFKLPFSIIGAKHDDIKPYVNAQGLKPRIAISHPILDFGTKVLCTEETHVMPHRLYIRLENEDDKEVSWHLGEIPDQVKSCWRLEPSSGRLPPGHSDQIQVLFMPKEVTSYSTKIPVLLDENQETKYTKIELKGTGITPMITFSHREILLPVVPLGLTSKITFEVNNEGYDRLELKYRLPADKSKVPLSLSFPEGSVLGGEKQILPVEVSFTSKKPMAFQAKIFFYDEEGTKFTIPISGVCDNCLLTNFPFLASEADNISIRVAKDKIITLQQKEEKTGEDFRPIENPMKYSVSSGTTLTSSSSSYDLLGKIRKKIYSRKNIYRLVYFLNVCVLDNPIDDLITDCVNSDGQILYKILEKLCGKKPSSGKKRDSSRSRKDSSNQLFQQYESLLTFLKSYGALLSNVKAEYLLKYEDYIVLFNAQQGESNQEISIYPPKKKFSERRFYRHAMEAWATVFYQIIKIFLLNRINPRFLRDRPGLPEEVKRYDHTLSQSNVYNISECILLKWINHYFAKKYPSKAFWIARFDSDLKDGIALAAVIQCHIPSSENTFKDLVLHAESSWEYQQNIQTIIRAMRENGLRYPLDASDFLKYTSRDMVLFVLYLFETLPYFMPQTKIKFNCTINERLIKTIELSNPSNDTIEYNIYKNGADEFSIQSRFLKINPKDRAKFSITALCTFAGPFYGRVTFLSTKTGLMSSTVVFDLEATTENNVTEE
eukprot:gb/GECH01008306.1/.p1 GENE.gb/GECH01008306.1/~~gb/GECH01008306.1/.p1  ORF type:complete len:1295 (+),score=319.63 gb/GECH01008306.1/:1-3885(+)